MMHGQQLLRTKENPKEGEVILIGFLHDVTGISYTVVGFIWIENYYKIREQNIN
jgi:hypothetical protein